MVPSDLCKMSKTRAMLQQGFQTPRNPVMKHEACVLACTKTWNARMPERRNTKTGNPEHKITKTRNAF